MHVGKWKQVRILHYSQLSSTAHNKAEAWIFKSHCTFVFGKHLTLDIIHPRYLLRFGDDISVGWQSPVRRRRIWIFVAFLLISPTYSSFCFKDYPGTSGKESACHCGRCKRHGLDPQVRKMLWKKKWQPAPIFLSG